MLTGIDVRIGGAPGVVLAVFLAAAPAAADRRVTTENRDYRVYGHTPRELVSYMKSRPFRGDYGPAMANIRPRYRLDLKTRQVRGGCAVKSVSVPVRFVVTLPKAVNERSFDRRTRRAWRSFRRFAARHENVHRRIYLGCVRRFQRQARRTRPMASCSALRYHLQRRLRDADTACDRRHRAFDRRDFRRVRNLALFRQARAQKRRLARAPRRFTRSQGRRGAVRTGQVPPSWFMSLGRDR